MREGAGPGGRAVGHGGDEGSDLGRVVAGPGDDLLSHVLRRSTMGATGFHGRVRKGIGWGTRAMITRSSNHPPAGRGAGPRGGGGGQAGKPLGMGSAVATRLSLEGVEVDRAIRTGKLERVAALAHPAYRRGGLPRL